MIPFEIGDMELIILIWIILPCILGYWVYIDGEKRGEEKPEWWALAVCGLGYFTFFGGLLAFAIYIRQRS